MVDTDNPGVPVWESGVTVHPFFTREEHDVCVGPRVSRFLHPACVVRRRSESNGLVFVNFIPIEYDVVAIFMVEDVLVALICLSFDAWQEVVDKARPKVLSETCIRARSLGKTITHLERRIVLIFGEPLAEVSAT